MIIGTLLIIVGSGMFIEAWRAYNKHEATKEVFLEVGKMSIWLVVFGLIFFIWG